MKPADLKVKILVCEDNEDHRFLILDSLKESLPEAQYMEAETGRECLDLLKINTPDVLILDYRLDDMDGLEILEEIQRTGLGIAVLLVTSQGDETIAVSAMKMGARDYLVKDTHMSFIKHLPISVDHAIKQIRSDRDNIVALERLKSSEELNRTIIDQMSQAVLYTDENGIIRHLNSQAGHLFDVELARGIGSSITADPFIRLIPDIKSILERYRRTGSKEIVESEFSLDPDHYLLCRVSPVFESKNGFHGLIIVLVDMTERKRLEMERLESIHQMVFALAKAVELRDPYTSGHAANVALISTRIAACLDWDKQRITGLRLAGELHDIGKIAIPAEILTRPTKLSPLEREMLKEHPVKGFEILKDIRFPFPIAESVLQHHEVLDGSGYPRGLSGDEIIQEARILAVADVLDAITSHRPYREGLGIDNALEQISSGRNKLYDRVVVDVALELIAQSGHKPFWRMQSTATEPDYRSLRDKS